MLLPLRRLATRPLVAVLVILGLTAVPASARPSDVLATAPSGAATQWVVELAVPVARPGRHLAAAAAGRDRVAAAVASAPGAEVVRTLDHLPYALVEADAAQAALLAGSPGVVAVRPALEVTAFGVPNDPFYPEQWNLPAIQAPEVWDRTTGLGVTVAVLDTGVARSLSDLAQTRIAPGIDLVDNDNDPDDQNGHGTHVIGTVAQSTNNGTGVAGVAYDARILPVKVLDARGIGSEVTIAAGIEYAVDNGADVINLSLGAPSPSVVIASAVEYAVANGVIVVAAVGNDGADRISYPAAIDDVIAVGAVAQTLTVPAYSNRGPKLDLVAPGGDLTVDSDLDGQGDGILQQTILTGGLLGRSCYCFYEGTSMAAPHVAAAAALLLSAGVASERVPGLLIASARDLGVPGRDDRSGAGLLQIADALALAATTPAPEPPPGDAPTPDDGAVTAPSEPARIYAPGTSRDFEDACPSGSVPPSGYGDVSPGSVHLAAIDCVTFKDVAEGTGDGRFSPGLGVTRAQLATLLARALEAQGRSLPTSPPDVFDDDDGSVHELRINQLAALGIVKGRTERVFEPGRLVSRAQIASFLVATVEDAGGELQPPVRDDFDDDDGSIHESSIQIVAEHGIATGVGTRTYAPERTLSREQMASLLARTLDLLVERSRA